MPAQYFDAMDITFDDFNLNKGLENALLDRGFHTPTHIQAASYSTIMSGRDVIGIAQTGTGKTMAYLLPLLRMWKFTKERHPQILIVVPTRELVTQVVEETKLLTTYMNVQTVGVFGGVNIKRQIEEVQAGLDVLVGTPGRLLDLCLKGALKLKNVKKFVIDEVDEMLNLGFRHQLLHLFDLLPSKRQNLLFSATMIEEVEDLIETFFNGPVVVEAAPSGTPLENINQYGYEIPNFKSKVDLLHTLLSNDESMSKVLIFVETKKLADILHTEIEQQYHEQIGVIHSNKSQNYRFNAVNSFKDGSYRILIATDIIARGIDISDVTHVINFDLPDTPEKYVHRIGRTGRADAQGEAISFIGQQDLEHQINIESLMDMVIPIKPLPEGVEIIDEMIDYERPQLFMRNNLTKGPKIEVGKAFEAKKKVLTPLSRRQKEARKKHKKKK